MITVDQLADMVEDESRDAMKYAKAALACKDEAPEMAALFITLSDEEMQHMARLHEKLRAMYKTT